MRPVIGMREKEFIVACFALGLRWTQIVEEFGSRFPDVPAPQKTIAYDLNLHSPAARAQMEDRAYRGKVTDGRCYLKDKQAKRLLDVFDEACRKCEEDPLLDVPIGRLGYRLRQYQEMYDKAVEYADKAASGPNPNYERVRKCLDQALSVLKQAAEERGGLYTNKRHLDLSLEKMSDDELRTIIFTEVFDSTASGPSALDRPAAAIVGGSGPAGIEARPEIRQSEEVTPN